MGQLKIENEVYMLPASYGQNRMWFFEQMFPNSVTYGIPFILKIKGGINKKILEQALQMIIDRHEVLRTTFEEREGELFQKVFVECPHLRLEEKNLDEIKKIQTLQSYLKAFAKESFDLQEGPLIKFELICVEAQYHYLLVNVHHIIFDAWSINIFEKELLEFYSYLNGGVMFDLDELPLQYADYAAWQKESLGEGDIEKKLDFWGNYLRDASSILNLPSDRIRPQKPSYEGENYKFKLPEHLVISAQEFCRANNITYYTFFLTIFNILLYRYSGQKDIVIGTPITNRKDKQIQDLIGFFVNTLPVRTMIQSKESFKVALRDTLESFLQAHENGDVPFERIVQEVSPERDTSYHPIFQVLFTLHEKNEVSKSDVLFIEHEKINTGTSKFDLVLYVSCAEDEINGEIEYSTDLFDHVSIEHFFQNYIACMQALLASPNKPIAQVSMLSEKEQCEFIVRKEEEFDNSRFISQLFEEQVFKYANKIAIKGVQGSFSYKDLNERSNQVANELQKKGIEPGSIVGVCLKRSPEQIATLIGILKSGCAYLPIDTASPKERIKLIVEDSSTKFIITDGADLKGISGVSLLQSDSIFCNGSKENVKWTLNKPPEKQLAYVIYTSGSTGKPKGIGVSHASFVNHIQGMLKTFPISSDERVLQNITYSFDASVTEIFATLIGGGTLILTHPDHQFDIDYLADLMIKESVTRAQLFHSLINKLIHVDEFREKNKLRHVFTGGEALSGQLVQLFYEKLGKDIVLVNLYGPTEATVASTYWISEPKYNQSTAPIGRALPGYHLLILNEELQPVPKGGVGELFIGGKGLALGYLNNNELNKSAFLSLNINGESNLYYRTGDLVKQLSNGDLLFLSRKDSQVKIRGFRIELDEIKHRLLEQPEIENAVVVVEKIKGDKKIFSFITRMEGTHVTANEVKERLKNTLPHYMIPQVISWVEKIPITLNGKVNKKILPFDKNDLVNTEKIFAGNLFEKQLVGIWEEVLNLQSVGVNEDFFDLGGHSIKAIEIIGLIRKRLGIHLPISCLFEYRTIRGISEYKEKMKKLEQEDFIISLKKVDSEEPPLFLIHPGGGGALCYVPLVRYIDKNISVFGIQSQGYETNKEPLTTIAAMAKLYAEKILKIQPKGPYRLAGWSMGGTLAVEVARILESKRKCVSFVGLIDAHPFDCSMKKVSRQDPLAVWAYSLGIKEKDFNKENETEKYQIVLKAAQEKGTIPRNAELEDVKRIIKVMATNNMASDQYEFGEPIHSDLFLLNCEELDPSSFHQLVNIESWKNRTKGEVYTSTIKGHHNNLMQLPQVEYIGELISKFLEGR
ncbi:hypothetical protein BAMA_00645 [Bacillus manliponensis]|uniref:Carrier domain-containing protein n=1 Tax=Bacillus manliponensis TaxID=574376 RepID=A0A073K4C1_9BACI|nr:non-ribosomal peptide synthetase [Bacillus manliponensis]KEK21312.1 hypothetical protein BAMA_00645 [Bacillus manliponensis]